MLDIKIDPQLLKLRILRWRVVAKGATGGGLRLRFQKPTKDLLPGGSGGSEK